MPWGGTSSSPSAPCFCGHHLSSGRVPWLSGAALGSILQMIPPTLPKAASSHPCGDTRTRHSQRPDPQLSGLLSKLELSLFLFLSLGASCFCSLLLSWYTSVIFFFVLGDLFYFYPLPFWVWLNNYFILNYLSWSNCMVSTFLTRPQLI